MKQIHECSEEKYQFDRLILANFILASKGHWGQGHSTESYLTSYPCSKVTMELPILHRDHGGSQLALLAKFDTLANHECSSRQLSVLQFNELHPWL